MLFRSALKAMYADRRLHQAFWQGTSDFKLWMRAILLGLPLIPPLLIATGKAAAGMVSALVAMGPGVGMLAAAVIGNFQKIKKEAGLGDLKDSWKSFLEATRPVSLRIMTTAFRMLADLLPRLVPLTNAFGRVFGNWLDKLEDSLQSKAFDRFLKWVETVGAANFGNMLRGLESLASGIGKFAMAFSGAGLGFTNWFESTMQKFEDWAGSLKKSDGFKGFMEYFRETWPSVREMFKQFGRAMENLLRAVAPWGDNVADGLAAVFRTIANADPEHIRRVVLALLGFRAAGIAIGAAAGALATLNMALGRFNRRSDETRRNARKTEKGFVGLGKGAGAAKAGIVGAAIGVGMAISGWIKKDRELSRSWERLKREASRLWNAIKEYLGPSVRLILIKTFNGLAKGAEKAADAMPILATAVKLMVTGALAALETLARALAKLFETFAHAAAKLAPFNPIMGRVAMAMAGAAGKARALAADIQRLRSKTITVTTNFVRNFTVNRHTNYTSSGKLGRQGQEVNMGYATGGRPPVGKASWVGERGPELFIPDVPGQIVPAHQAKGVAQRTVEPGGGTDNGTLAKAVGKAVAAALNGATLRVVDADGTARRAYLNVGNLNIGGNL